MKYRFLSILTVCFLLSGCTSLTPERKTDTDLIVEARADSIRRTGRICCLYPADTDPANQPDAKELQSLVESRNCKLIFVPMPAKEIPASLRAGKGDLAIGTFTAEDAQNYYLGSVSFGEKTVCLIRRNDSFCRTLLAASPAEK